MWLEQVMNKRATGAIWEQLAVDYLSQHGLVAIERNFSCEQGEIDIICQDQTNNDLVFVEVRYRKDINFGTPIESINWKKQRKLIQLAVIYIKQKIQYHEIYCEFEPTYRFDAVGISGDLPTPKIEWLQNVISV